NGTREQGLAGPGRADQQHAARDAPAEALEFSGIAQELDDLLEILLGFIDSRNVFECHPTMRLGQKLGATLAETERLAACSLHLSRQEYPHADEGNERKPRHQERDEPGHVILLRTRGDRDALAIKSLDQARIVRRICLEAAPVGECAVDLRTLNKDVADAPLIDLVEQLREGDVLSACALTRVLKQREQGEQKQDNDHPKGEVAQVGIHPFVLTRSLMSRAGPFGLYEHTGRFTSVSATI